MWRTNFFMNKIPQLIIKTTLQRKMSSSKGKALKEREIEKGNVLLSHKMSEFLIIFRGNLYYERKIIPSELDFFLR